MVDCHVVIVIVIGRAEDCTALKKVCFARPEVSKFGDCKAGFRAVGDFLAPFSTDSISKQSSIQADYMPNR